MFNPDLRAPDVDPELAKALAAELQRQEDHVELIASDGLRQRSSMKTPPLYP